MTADRIPARERSLATEFITMDQAQEYRARRILFAKARAGHEDSLACLRDEYGLQTLKLDGKLLIDGGVLVGSRRPA